MHRLLLTFFTSSLHPRRNSAFLGLFLSLLTARAQTVTYNNGDNNTSAQTVPITLDIASGTATQSGDVTGTGSLTKTGAGTIILSGNVAYTGTTTISAGTLQLQCDNPFAGTSSIGTGSIVNSGTLAANFNSLANFRGRATIANAISGSGGVVVLANAYLMLTGSNSYSGGTTLNDSSTLTINSLSALGSGSLTINGYGTLNFSAAIGTFDRGIVFNGAGAGVSFSSNNNVTISSDLSCPNLYTTGSGTFTLTGHNTVGYISVTGGATLVGNTDSFNGATNVYVAPGSGGIVFNQASDGTFAGVLAMSYGAFTKTGTGNLTLANTNQNNSFGSAISIAQGTLTFGAANALSHSYTVGPNTVAAPDVNISAGATLNVGAFDIEINRLHGTGSVTGTALSYVSATDLTLTTSFSGGLTFTKGGTSTLTLSATSTHTGGTTLNDGIVAVGADNALGSGSVTLNGGALQGSGGAHTLANPFSLNADTTVNGSQALTLSGDFTLTHTRELTVSNSALTTISGTIADGGLGRSLNKYGSGTLELTGANTYSGGTFVGAGTVRINNSSGSAFGTGAVTVASGATLTGAGSFTGALQNNGTYSPGNSPALTTLSTFNQGSSGTLMMELGGLVRGTGYDALNVTGALTFGGTLQVSLINSYAVANGDSFDLFNWGSSSGSFSTVSLPPLGSGLSWDTTSLYSTGVLTAIPEPSTYGAIAGLGALALAGWRRRVGRGRRADCD